MLVNQEQITIWWLLYSLFS